MKFSDFLKESIHNEWDVNWPTPYKKVDADAIKAVKSVLNKTDVIKAIDKEMQTWQGASNNVSIVESTLSIYGTYKDEDTVYTYLQFIYSDELSDEAAEYYEEFDEGDVVYSNGFAIFNLNSGKLVNAGNEEANELYSTVKEAAKQISKNNF